MSATNDLATDQRVKRLCDTLHKEGYEIILTGRILPGSLALNDRPYKTIRTKHLFNKGFFFYAEYNIRLFFFLLISTFDILHSNDLDTLPANFLASRIKCKPIIYDSHEYFTEVPELTGRPIVKKTWEIIERLIFPHLKFIITVNNSIALAYEKKYGKYIYVIRNVPVKPGIDHNLSTGFFGLPENKKFIIFQGSGINRDRGAEEAIEAMEYVNNAILIIAGKGDVINELKDKASKTSLNDKVIFLPLMPYEKLIQLTRLCDCGLSLDKESNLNYRYSLPNKLFDYIMAGIPVIVSPMPEITRIVKKYKTGLIIKDHSPCEIAEKINTILFRKPKNSWKANLDKASIELNWDVEKHKLLTIYKQI